MYKVHVSKSVKFILFLQLKILIYLGFLKFMTKFYHIHLERLTTGGLLPLDKISSKSAEDTK